MGLLNFTGPEGFGDLSYSSGSVALPSETGFSSITKAAGGGMWPLAIASLGSSVISGIFGGQAANRQADAQMQAAYAQAQATRDSAFSNLLAGQYALTGAKQFDRFQQQKAADYQQAFLDPRTSQLASEDRQRGMTDQLSPMAQQLRRQANIDQLNRDLASRRAVTDAMFGQIAQNPFAYGNVPGYAA